jgi:hypothetical protein
MSLPGALGVLPEGGRAYSGNLKAKPNRTRDKIVVGYFQAMKDKR